MRWLALIALLGCGGSEKPVGVAMSAPPTGDDAGDDLSGLFGGSSGGSGSLPTLQEEDAAAVGNEDAAVDAAVEHDGDAAPGDSGVVDAGEDAGAVNPQCQPCDVIACPNGYACVDRGSEGRLCHARPTAGVCPEHLVFVSALSLCYPDQPSCEEWLVLYGNQ